MVFNGEIYNYVELRRELTDRGWDFTSTGDTEVLLKAYLEWGVEAFSRLDGMWACAIYDEEQRTVLLSRDRFGEKPLFWTSWMGGVAFASEIKQLSCYPGLRLRLDAASAARYLATGRPYDGASSMFDGIAQLEPGSWLSIGPHGSTPGRYYDLGRDVAAVPAQRSAEDWAEVFAEALSASVKRRLRSDVPVGTSLSSGVDSSAILAEATAQGHAGYRTFTAVSSDHRVDEGGPAGRFASAMGSLWTPVRADPNEFAGLWDRVTWHQEAPVPSTSLYGQWKVFETARAAGVIVILDGQGADEILGGYNKFVAAAIWQATRHGRRRELLPAVRGFARQVGTLRTLRTAGYRYLGRLGTSVRPDSWLRPGLYAGDRAPRVRDGTYAQRVQDIQRWSLPNLLTYADRNSMAHSVETRLPFLDATVVAVAMAMPDNVLFRDGWTKWPLRRALAARGGQLPAWTGGKRWFGIPQQDWLRTALSPYVDAWTEAPHEGWEEVAAVDELRSFQSEWRRRGPDYARDDYVFKLVSLDRFLRVWFP